LSKYCKSENKERTLITSTSYDINENALLFADGNCSIVAKEKHLCKKCRYFKCLSIGMNAKWVLSNEEVISLFFTSKLFKFLFEFFYRNEFGLKNFSSVKTKSPVGRLEKSKSKISF